MFWLMDMKTCFALVICCLVPILARAATPPFHGTIFVEPEIIRADDPTSFEKLSKIGAGKREMFDRRIDRRATFDVWLFEASFDDGMTMEVQVNAEFSEARAEEQAKVYLPAIGQLPKVLRADIQTVSIHQGDNPFGGGNRNVLIHTGMGAKYIQDGILEETLFHEASHTSLDDHYRNDTRWKDAQKLDGEFISTYARDNPKREDIAESYLLFFAVQFKRERIKQSLFDTTTKTMPNRMKFFESANFPMHPVVQ